MAFGTFNGVPIGDEENGILAIRPGNFQYSPEGDRLTLEGKLIPGPRYQTIVIEAWKQCASTVDRLLYIGALLQSFGRREASLIYNGEGGSCGWQGCTVASTHEDESSAGYIKFTLTLFRRLDGDTDHVSRDDRPRTSRTRRRTG